LQGLTGGICTASVNISWEKSNCRGPARLLCVNGQYAIRVRIVKTPLQALLLNFEFRIIERKLTI